MIPVTTPHEFGEGASGRTADAFCGLLGLAIAAALFLTQYATIVALADSTLGVLSSTAIVWIFVTTWLLLWLGIELALVRFTQRPASA